jgi:hypothetical protein
MGTNQVEYLGFRCGETTRDYRLLVRHPDGGSHEFTLVIQQDAFLTHQVRYQDAAEICFLKLNRAIEACALLPVPGLPAARLDITEADLLEYRESHAPKPRRLAPPRPAASPAAPADVQEERPR